MNKTNEQILSKEEYQKLQQGLVKLKQEPIPDYVKEAVQNEINEILSQTVTQKDTQPKQKSKFSKLKTFLKRKKQTQDLKINQ